MGFVKHVEAWGQWLINRLIFNTFEKLAIRALNVHRYLQCALYASLQFRYFPTATNRHARPYNLFMTRHGTHMEYLRPGRIVHVTKILIFLSTVKAPKDAENIYI